MEMSKIKVFVKLNENNEITQIGSSIFLQDTTDFIQIDEGNGDKYAHAQSQYLPKSICDEQGRYNFKLVDGEVVEVAEEDKPVIEVVEEISDRERIEVLEQVVLEAILKGVL